MIYCLFFSFLNLFSMAFWKMRHEVFVLNIRWILLCKLIGVISLNFLSHCLKELSVRQWPGRQRLNPWSSHTKDSKILLDVPLLNTQHYKVRIKWKCVIFWPSTQPKNAIPRWYTGRKWHIPMASNRKRSRGRIKAYDMGQGEGPIVPLQWCTGRE